jgi:hypothetical protein
MKILALALILLLSGPYVARAQVTSQAASQVASGDSSQVASQSASQEARVKGMVKDSINESIPQNTVILLMKPRDSTLVAFARADARGRFEFPKVLPGSYLLWISHPAFATYRDSVHFSPGSNDLGNIFLTLRSQILKEVIIKGINPVRLKGDTVEYAADSFAVRPNATVEDLLKRLPGIQVDKNGKITAQGQTVQKVLVDGEEFFSDDPTVATRNLPANSVDKVQVFDKKSDQAAFTGIDDGQQVKTINLKLKNDKKNGYFGKVNAGAGTGGYYENTAAINLFEKKRKIALYGVAANTGKVGLNWQDQNNYGSSGLTTVMDGGDVMMYFSGASDDFTNWSGTYNGQGVPVAQNLGAHYSNKWDDDKISLTGDYTYNRVKVGLTDNTISQLILPDSTTNITHDVNRSNNTDQQHMVNAKYDYQVDSSSDIKITLQGKMRHKDTFTEDTSNTVNGDSLLLNKALNNTNISGQNNSFNSTLLWLKKMHKKGRTLALNIQENYTEINSTGHQYSLISGYDNGVFQSNDTTDQYKTSYSRNLTLENKLSYTEPLGGNTYLVIDYGLDLLSGTSDKNAYNRNSEGKYLDLDSTYSNFYNLSILTNAGGLFFKKATKKYTWSLGSDVGYTAYHQDNVYQDSLEKRNFINFYPKGAFTYKFSGQSAIRLNYYGNTTQPSLDQLQPVASNNNPLNIVTGNPLLKPSFTSRITGNFNDFKVLSERGIYIWSSYTIVNNAFSTKDSVDATGKQYSQTVNVKNTQSFNIEGGYNFKWKKPQIGIGFNGNAAVSTNVNFVNGQENDTRSGNYTLGLNLDKSKDKAYSFNVNANATYNTSISSIQSSTNTNYWTYLVNADFSKDLPLKFLFDINSNMNFRQKTALFNTNSNTAIVNASIAKMFMKNDALVLKVGVNDIFNQNTGFSRNISTNNITQSTYTAIHRYGMISVTWNFAKNGKPSEGFF